LIGKWEGKGSGGYPTLKDEFQYREETIIEYTGKPFLTYQQRTWDVNTNTLMHSESGYFRTPPDKENAVELVVADPTGVTSIMEGIAPTMQKTLTLKSTTVSLSSTAKQVNEIVRTYELDSTDTLNCKLEMAAVGHPLHLHLTSALINTSQLNITPVTAHTLPTYISNENENKPLIVDVRTKEEYASGHIPGSILIPVVEFAGRVNELEGRDVLLVCRSGKRSTIAARTLLLEGYKGKIYELNKGLMTWGDQMQLVK